LNAAWRRWYTNTGAFERIAAHESVKMARGLETVAQAAIDERDSWKEIASSFNDIGVNLVRERDAKILAQEVELLARKFEVEELNQEIARLKTQLAAKVAPPDNAPVPAQPAAGEVGFAPAWCDKQSIAVVRKASEVMTKDELADIAPALVRDLLLIDTDKRGPAWIRITMAAANHGGVGDPPAKFGLTGKAQEAVIKVGH
jgi:hypothetical protein